MGRDAEVAVDRARKQVADAIGAKSNEIYFTSGVYQLNGVLEDLR